MNCEQLRSMLCEQPGRRDAELERHMADCAACRAFSARLERSERLLERALRFDLGRMRGATRHHGRGRRVSTVAAAFAVALLAGANIWSVMTQGPWVSNEVLASSVAEHWYHEPDSWVRTDREVSATHLAAVVGDEFDLSPVGRISYVRICLVAGQWVPHVVVQSERGPVMALLMPHRPLDAALPLEVPGESIGGRVVPAGQGSIAVLGSDARIVGEIESALVLAADRSI